MRVLVTGGRDYTNSSKVYVVLDGLNDDATVNGGYGAITELAQGGARGADTLARGWAAFMDIRQQTFMADWDKHGKSAGPIRNQQMLDEFKPDLVVAFPGGKGTAHMVSIARKAGVEVIEVSDET